MPLSAVLDTNVLVDYLNGVAAAREELERWPEPVISIVTWMEVLVGARDEDEDVTLRGFMQRFEIARLDRDVATEAVALRREHRVRLPDAVIWGTARARGALLVTRNTRDFPEDDPGVRVPYRLGSGP